MKKCTVAKLATATIDTRVPQQVSELLKTYCPIVVVDLSRWTIHPSRHSTKGKELKGKELLGVFGFENGKPIIGLNHKALRTKTEVIKTTLHEVAHFYLWFLGLANGERVTNKLAKQWGGDNL